MISRLLITGTFILTGLINGNAQIAPNPPPPQPTATAPEKKIAELVKFEKIEHDYGTIKKGADGNCEFRFKNISKEPVVVVSAVGSCGCTVPSPPKEPIASGGSDVIKVHYNTNNAGPIRKTVTVVLTTQGETQTVTLSIKGTVEDTPKEEPFPAKKDMGGAPVEVH